MLLWQMKLTGRLFSDLKKIFEIRFCRLQAQNGGLQGIVNKT
jgi:hypothetical protein